LSGHSEDSDADAVSGAVASLLTIPFFFSALMTIFLTSLELRQTACHSRSHFAGEVLKVLRSVHGLAALDDEIARPAVRAGRVSPVRAVVNGEESEQDPAGQEVPA
jgi:hypothetical protein